MPCAYVLTLALAVYTYMHECTPTHAFTAAVQTGVSPTYEKWGIEVERIELQDLRPKATSDTANAMKKQMIAERRRRSEFIHAEGNKAAMRLKSEGIKIVKANLVRGLPYSPRAPCTLAHTATRTSAL